MHTSAPDTDFGLEITDTVTLIDPPPEPDATLVLPTESWLRLASGRLGAAVTPAGVTVTGPLDLDHPARGVPRLVIARQGNSANPPNEKGRGRTGRVPVQF